MPPERFVKLPVSLFTLAVLRGCAQIFLQNNAITGSLFLVGLAVVSPVYALSTVVALLLVTSLVCILHFNQEIIAQGLYGYNAALVGIAIPFYFHMTSQSVLLLLAGVICTLPVSAAMKVMLNYRKLPVLTAPFIIVTWAVILLGNTMGLDPSPSPLHVTPWLSEVSQIPDVAFKGIGEVMFQGNILSGGLLLIGIALASWRCAIAAFFGAIIGAATGTILQVPQFMAFSGIYGYNAALGSVSMILLLNEHPLKQWIWALLCAALSTLLFHFTKGIFATIGLPALTLPFVIATWLCLELNKAIKTLWPA